MEKATEFRWKFLLLFTITTIVLCMFIVQKPNMYRFIPNPRRAPKTCPLVVSEKTITPLNNTRHLLVSAYMDQRVTGFDLRIIGIFKRNSIQPLYCRFCCAGYLSSTTPTKIHLVGNFGFPFVTTNVMCPIPPNCTATHVTLMTEPTNSHSVILPDQPWIPIRNKKSDDNVEEKLQFNFTVCISALFGEYNNVLQFAQSLEMYRLLGVDRVAIYVNSCSREVERLLQLYSQEGFVEMIPWPIDKHLNPSKGCRFVKHGGDVHFYGQMTTLNDCVYRFMTRSRYVLLNDIDEIIMPYQHNDLMSLMSVLQKQHAKTAGFRIQTHTFPIKYFEPSGRFHLPQWDGVPGVNILEHISRLEPNMNVYHNYKMILQPRLVEQTSVHELLRHFGQIYKVPPDICLTMHVRAQHNSNGLTQDQPIEDKRLWDFHEKLIPNVDKVLSRAGLRNTKKEEPMNGTHFNVPTEP